jgi:hypothetical protein
MAPEVRLGDRPTVAPVPLLLRGRIAGLDAGDGRVVGLLLLAVVGDDETG